MALLCLFLFLFLYLLPKKWRAQSAKLAEHFGGSTFWFTGTFQFKFQKRTYFVSRVSRGGGIGFETGGSYPVLWSYVRPFPKMIIGHAKASDFTRGSFLVLPPNEVFQCGSANYLCGSTDAEKNDEVKSLALQDEVREAFTALFQKPFQHLTISSDFHWVGFFLKRTHVLRYVCLPEIVYLAPSHLESRLKHLELILDKLGIES